MSENRLREISGTEYVLVLQALKLYKYDRRMLEAHYEFPGRSLTSRQMGRALGFKHPFDANLHYSNLARRIGKCLGVSTETKLDVLVTMNLKESECHWVMRPALAAALEQLGWVPFSEAVGEEMRAGEGRAFRLSLVVDQELSAFEGEARRHFVLHRKREARLRSAKIAAALGASFDQRLRCEVPGCGFEFVEIYGNIGNGYAQVHHLKPLGEAQASRETTLVDLAVVCANCHVMIHRGGDSRPLEGLIQKGW